MRFHNIEMRSKQNSIFLPLANQQGKVYGAHFAWSHLWWAIAYPLAGFLGSEYFRENFLYGGVLSLVLILVFYFVFYKKQKPEKEQ